MSSLSLEAGGRREAVEVAAVAERERLAHFRHLGVPPFPPPPADGRKRGEALATAYSAFRLATGSPACPGGVGGRAFAGPL